MNARTNRGGRPRRQPRTVHSAADIDQMIIDKANEPVIVFTGDDRKVRKKLPKTRLEYNIEILASGAPTNRLAANNYIELVRGAHYRRDRDLQDKEPRR
ncbi:hypothetical protein [Sphingomonas montanisoli]|uniref:Uncharacterized protein n=1 Tax=Sphingomonas montanisoli TaxID=2606412 RepID=A0A5D9C716_9SPHN|nr:hypothetical protein [Sphingomonas montanisoli]TZG25805.1 hypothetical protein FYJ91_12495 [Sphingomonas montanisoli]